MAPRVGAKQVCSQCHHAGHNTIKCPNGEASRICGGCYKHITYLKYGFTCHQCKVGSQKTNYCSNCGAKGHNIRTCL